MNDWEPIRDRLTEQGRRYGDEIDAPLVIAINTGAFNLDKIDVMQALFGQESFYEKNGSLKICRLPNGAWHGPNGPQYTRISGVLVFNDLRPSNVADRKQCLYLNP